MIRLTATDGDGNPYTLWVNPDYVVMVRPHTRTSGCSVSLAYGEGYTMKVGEDAETVTNLLSGVHQ